MMRNTKKRPFALLSSREVYKNPWMTVREDSVIRPGGKKGIFGVVTQVGGSSIIPLDDEGNIYLSREYRYALEGFSLEAFGGCKEEGETDLDAAKRELKEEMGATATQWTDLGILNPFTAIIKCHNAMYLAKGLTIGVSDLDEGEEMEVVKIPLEKAINMVMDGDISHGATSVAILKIARILSL